MGKWIQKLPSKSKSECGKPAIYVYQCNLNLFVLEKYCYETNDSIDGWKYILTTPTVSVGQESRLSWGPLAQGHPRDCHQAVGSSWIVISRLNMGKATFKFPHGAVLTCLRRSKFSHTGLSTDSPETQRRWLPPEWAIQRARESAWDRGHRVTPRHIFHILPLRKESYVQPRGKGITQGMNARKQWSGVAILEAAYFSLFILNINSKNRNYFLIVKMFKYTRGCVVRRLPHLPVTQPPHWANTYRFPAALLTGFLSNGKLKEWGSMGVNRSRRHRLSSVWPVQPCFAEITLPHLVGALWGGYYAFSSPYRIISSPPDTFSHNMASYQKEMLTSSWTDWTLKFKLLPCPLSGLLQAGCLCEESWESVVSSSLSLFGTSTPALLPPSGSTGLPLSLSGLGDGKPIKGALFFFQSQFFWLLHRFPLEALNCSFPDVSKVSPSFRKQPPVSGSH